MNNDIIFVSNQIMDWFKQRNLSVGDIMTNNHLLSLSCETPIWNNQQRQSIPNAIEYLIEQGNITANDNDFIRLSQKGYDRIQMESQSEIQGIEYSQGGSMPIMNQTNYNISNSSLVGSQIGTTNSQLNFNKNTFSDEINEAIVEIKSIEELSKENMETIIELLGQIDVALQSDNKEAQAEAKFTLKGMLKGIGNAGVKVVSVLSGLANLAKFFGFPAP